MDVFNDPFSHDEVISKIKFYSLSRFKRATLDTTTHNIFIQKFGLIIVPISNRQNENWEVFYVNK